MTIGNPPTSNRNDIRLISAWRQSGSQTVLWAVDMTTKRLLHLVQWGGEVYLPVVEGLRLGIGLYNGSPSWMAYPTYIEGKNLYDDGPSQPNDCTPNTMWEVRPGTEFVMDALMGHGQTGRPLIIVQHGEGMGIGEATFGTDEYRGQIRVYERAAYSSTVPPLHSPIRPPGSYGGGYREAEGFGPHTFGGATRSAGPASYGTKGIFTTAPTIRTDHQVGIGAGAEEVRGNHQTGIQYVRNSRLVAALRTESRRDLAEVLGEAQPVGDIGWFWSPSSQRWYSNWRSQTTLVSPHVPVASGPHIPEGWNQPASTY